MKNRIGLYIAAAVVLLLAVALLLWPRARREHLVTPTAEEAKTESSPQPSPSASGAPSPIGRPAPVHPELAGKGIPEKNEPVTIAKYLSLVMTPISFYGKAIDDKGNPVPEAHIAYQAGDKIDPNADSSKYSGTSDKDGGFWITGVHGVNLYVDVSKDGYYRTPPFDEHRGSYDGFTYAEPPSGTSSALPTESNPAIFVLRKKRNGVPLNHWGRSIQISKNGVPVNVKLDTGRSTTDGDLQIESWTEDQQRDAHGHYQWQCQVSVVGGGLVKRQEEFDFEAPAEGYQPYDEIAPAQERWTSGIERQYFVKTGGGNYARVRVEILTGRDQLLTVEGYYNPTPGDRNLEYNPNQQAAAQ